jgi:uncharacterized membrane-anchored protein
MKKYKWTLVLLNLVLVFGLFNHSLFQKEELISEGQLALLELAPVDPRSLMQGDYMVLNYAISEGENRDSLPPRGFCVVKLDSNGVAQKVRIQTKKTPLAADEYLIVYTKEKRGRLHIGAESYFFQEGEGDRYAEAKYGGLQIDREGNSLLVGLYDEERKEIE